MLILSVDSDAERFLILKLRQNLGYHKLKDNRDIETNVVRWMITQDRTSANNEQRSSDSMV